MHTQIIIHFANIFERANFGKLFADSSRIHILTNNFCILNFHWNGGLSMIRKYCPNSRILIKKIHNKRTTYTEWRP